MLVLLSLFSSFALKSGCSHMPHQNPKNLRNRFTTNPLNEIATQLPTKPLFTKMKLEPLFPFSWKPSIANFSPLSLFAYLSLFPLFAQC